jgi:putative transposase
MQELLALTEEDREIAMQRFLWLQPHLEESRSLRLVAAEAGLAFRTAQRWVALYRASGLASLARKTRLDHGARKVVSGSRKRAIEGLALESHPVPITSVHRQIKEYAEAIGDTVPSYWTVYDIVREVPPSLRTLAHQGAKSYGESFDLIHRREASKPNSIWQADHAQLDIKLLKEDGSTARPWLTIVIDDYSRAIAGYYLGFDAPSSIRTSLALRQGIWRKGHPHWQICGVPDILYTDNGADFTSKHLQQVAADLKIRLVFSIPGKPQGRGRIERFFRTVNEMFLCDLDGYIRHKKRAPSLSLDQFDERFRHFLLEIYHRRSNADGRLPPSERWEEGAFLPRMPESLEQLTSCSCTRCVPGRFAEMESISRDCAICHSRWLLTSERTQRFASTQGIWEKFACSIKTACCAEQSPLSWLERPSRCEMSFASNQRRKELRSILHDRQKMVDTLLQLKQRPALEESHVPVPVPTSPTVRIKRYRNE